MQRPSLIEYLESFRRRGSEIAYAHRRGYRMARWSYCAIAETACQFARELEGRGIGKGDRVLVWGENCAEWVAVFWGCVLRGTLVVPMDRIASRDFARRVSAQVGARLLVGSRECLGCDSAAPAIPFENLGETLRRHSGDPYASPRLSRDDTVEIVFTSGTTAEPKGVVISHGNILANLEPLENEIGKYLKLERLFRPIRFLSLVPLSHVFGQFLGIFVPQLLRGSVVFLDTFNPSEVMRAIQREKISVLVAVPRWLETLRDKVERALEAPNGGDEFRSQFQAAAREHFVKRWWRFRKLHGKLGWKFWAFISGGAALDRETEAFWRRLGFAVIQGYGLTESASLVSVNHPFRLGEGSIGKILPGLEAKLDETGEILVRGENISSAYWQGKEPTPLMSSAGSNDGWFHTGDLGELDAQGNLYFKGRKKDVIVTAEGMKVFPEDIESALRRQPEVADCVVVGVARGGNAEPCAVLILRDGISGAVAAIQRANESLAGYQQVRRWLVWPEKDFPRGSTQKPRTQLILQFVHKRTGEMDTQAAAHAQDSGLAGLIGRITGRAHVSLTADARLATDFNLSSIEKVELMSALEDRYQIDLNEARFASATTVGELETMLRQPAPIRSGCPYPRWAQRWPVTWIRPLVYRLLVWPTTLLLGYPRVRGRENLQGFRAPALIICNHITYFDISFILAALPAGWRARLAVAMGGERLRAMHDPPEALAFPTRWIHQIGYALVVALFNVFPLPQETGFRESFAFAGESVDRGYSVVVFPEGARTQDGKTAPFRAGIGLLASKLNIPIIPVRINGLFELKQAGKKAAPPGAITVAIGRPVRFDPDADPAAITRELESRVASLANPDGAIKRP